MTKKNAKRGRPPKADKDRRDSDLRVRMSDQERAAVKAAAASAGMEASTWARVVLIDAAKRGASLSVSWPDEKV